MALLFGDQEMFKLIWSSFKLDRNAVIDWILNKNNEGMNSFHMAINFHKIEILQPMLEFFSLHLNETEIIDIFDKSTKANYKFLDMVVLFYNESIFNLLVDFIHNHLSIENKKKIISSNIISFAVSKWQESALVKTLNFIENLFDENEIKEIIFAKNWENQTAFHVASKNSNLSQLQTLCKFAHYYLSTEDFVKIISTKDSNDYSIVNNSASHDEIYNNLPNLSNFATNYSVYVWIALLNDELDIPKEAIKIGAHENGEVIYLARGYKEKKVELFGITKSTDIKELEYQYIDILAGFGVNWINKDAENISPLKIENMEETYHIGKFENSVKLISAHSEEKFNELLCINNQILHETNLNNFIFKRSF
ncbi:hypothetical protein PVAND_008801 [Polypedilum vanderplanki]|uniref:Ankyrin repeat protein n=1 Tax=Polypedilum vanderplanki TaxID=319348 RepID=A0A9J6CAR1_POLVA|nr:hypothetical protein PVAND_008801 [Polypedilum vanderplanki]